jgi:BlaI family transcriptional regulator, penicillinase repressor
MPPKISEAEWRVIKLLWEKSPRSANEIVKALEGNVPWNARTIRTLINRLVQKNAISFDKHGRAYLYFPLIKQTDLQHAEMKTFVTRVFSGATKPFIAAFLQETDLTNDEINELEQLLKSKKK